MKTGLDWKGALLIIGILACCLMQGTVGLWAGRLQ